MLIRILSALILYFITVSAAWSQNVANGTVYLDINYNSVRDNTEPGIPDICVSNGREVVRTGDDGRWSLPVGDDTGLFVIKPGNYRVPLNKDKIPQFFYLHKPDGSPTLKTAGVEPSGPLPTSIDFPLQLTNETSRFNVLMYGDTQARGLREVDFITRDVVEECLGTDAAFGVSLGDIVADDPNLFAEVNQSIAQIGIPWYNVFGNHDNNRDANQDKYSDETFERFFGPSTYAFEYGQVVFIVLKNIFFKPEGGHRYQFTKDQLAFISNYLDFVPKEKLVTLLMHVPVVACENREDIYRLIENRPFSFSVSGHTHEQFHLFLTEELGWQGEKPHHHFVNATVSGSWWCGLMDEIGIPHATMNDGAPNGYSILTFNGNEYSIRFKAARRPQDYQMNIYLPDDINQKDAVHTEILVNVFAGSEYSKVEMKFGEGNKWISLKPTVTIDPECLRMHELSPLLDQNVFGKNLEDVFGWKMDYPSKSRHMWKGTLPSSPSRGSHTVTVRTTDMFGQIWTSHRIVRVR